MKKYILVLFLCLLLLGGCRARTQDADCASLGVHISTALPNGEHFSHMDEDFSETTFHFINETDEHVLLLDTTDAGTREIGIFKVGEHGDIKNIEQEIREYLKSEQEALTSLLALYPTDDLNERLWRYQNATVLTRGDYIAYFVLSHDDTQNAKSAFLNALQS